MSRVVWTPGAGTTEAAGTPNYSTAFERIWKYWKPSSEVGGGARSDPREDPSPGCAPVVRELFSKWVPTPHSLTLEHFLIIKLTWGFWERANFAYKGCHKFKPNKYNMYDFGEMTSALFRRPAHTLGGSLDIYLQIRKCEKPLEKAETLLKKHKLGCREEGVLPRRSDNA